jgi:uncharacterized protein YgbK (DUF1537 family)
MDKVVVLADDFTGAGDTGVHFARGGLKTALVFEPAAIPNALAGYDAIALSTETRFVPPQEAGKAVHDLAVRCREAGGSFFYKKVDSALRGNPGAETAAVLRALRFPAALICPAMPRAGRTVENGILFINGRPLHTTDLGRDLFTPVRASGVSQRFLADTGLKAGRVGLADLEAGRDALRRKICSLLEAGNTALVADAVTDAHLSALAELLLHSHDPASGFGPLLPVGSAGLGKALAAAQAGPARRDTTRPQGRMLAVVGSLNASAREQTEFAELSQAYTLLSLDVANGISDPDKECRRLVQAAKAADRGHILLRGLHPPKEEDVTVESGVQAAALFGQAAYALCREMPFTSVLVTGGSTAVSVAFSLGLGSVMLEDELLPGVVLSSCVSLGTGVRWFVSKAGSFGDRATLVAVAPRL